MPADPASAGPRRSAGERRTQLVEAAVGAFARTGLHGTAVSAVTDAVGVTQPYAFSLFRTKKGLFLAAVEHCFDHLETTFRQAASGRAGEDALQAMGDAYAALLEDREWLLLQLQAYAACGDEDVREVVRRRYAQLYELVRELSGAQDMVLHDFFAQGMLMNVAAALDLPQLAERDEGWLEWCRAAAPGSDDAGASGSDARER
jgi:AcrR family transcriptional regulator